MFIESFVLFSIFIYLLYRYGTNTFDHWSKLGVEYVKPLPFFGNLPIPGIHDQNIIMSMRKLYFQFYGCDYFGVYNLKRPALVVQSPELIKKILVKDFDYFVDRVASSGSHNPSGKYNLFACDQPLWSELRKRFSPAFTSAKLKNFQNVMNEKSLGFIKQLEKDGEIDLQELGGRYAIDVVASTSFGIVTNTLEDPNSAVRKNVLKMTDTQPFQRKLEFSVTFYAPELSPYLRTYFYTKEGSNFFRQIFKNVEQERKTMSKKVECFLDTLSKFRGETIAGIVKHNDIIMAQGIIFLFAAVESSATMLSLTLLELAHRPDCQERAYKEIVDAVARTGKLDYEAIKSLNYLEQCINETMRKYPILAALDRVCTRDYKVNDKFTIARGTSILINITGLHHDPKYFPNPNRWDPDRFCPENTITPFTFLPLGEGPRNCIGARYGMTSLKTVISNTVLNYQLKPHPKTPHPDDIKFSPNSVFPHPDCAIQAQFIKRSL